MFFALCAAISLAALFIVIAVTLLVSSAGGSFLRRFERSLAPAVLSNLLFSLRLLPFAAAFLFVAGFALPAFVRFEPRSSGEPVGLKLIILSLLGAAVLGRIGWQYYRVQRSTSRIRKQWLRTAEPLSLNCTSIPVYLVHNNEGLVAVTGILRPKIFLARGVLSSLTPAELQAVLAHEAGHVRSFDNLKQVLLKITQPPSWLRSLKSLDSAWNAVSEVAADEAALSDNHQVAVEDLASAVVKVSRLQQASPSPQLAACHLVPDGNCSVIGGRVLHLQQLLKGEPPSNRDLFTRRLKVVAYTVAATITALYIASLPLALPAVHEALEWLVK